MSDAELDNKSKNDNSPNYWNEKPLHEKAKHELVEFDLKLKSNQVVEVDQIDNHLDKMFSAVRQKILAMPSKIDTKLTQSFISNRFYTLRWKHH